jgi:glutathione S-transferase
VYHYPGTNNFFKRWSLEEEQQIVAEVKKSVPSTNFKAPEATSNMKGKIPMMYDMDESLENAGHKLVYLKDRTKKSKPGKFSARAKADKPKNRGLAILEESCKKEPIRDIEEAKLRISQARYSRKKAEALGRETRRSEKRYYECFKHATPQFHLTKLGEGEYAEKVANFARKGYALAS